MVDTIYWHKNSSSRVPDINNCKNICYDTKVFSVNDIEEPVVPENAYRNLLGPFLLSSYTFPLTFQVNYVTTIITVI